MSVVISQLAPSFIFQVQRFECFIKETGREISSRDWQLINQSLNQPVENFPDVVKIFGEDLTYAYAVVTSQLWNARSLALELLQETHKVWGIWGEVFRNFVAGSTALIGTSVVTTTTKTSNQRRI